MRLEDLNEYYDNLCDTFDRGEMDFVMNHDRAHNAVIECFMLNKSNVINMYCGEMSVFREGFYNHINQDNNYDLKEGETALGDEIKKKVIKSLREFINRPNVSLNIYFERFDRKFLRDLIDLRVFSDGVSSEKIRLFKLEDNLFLKSDMAHVSYTDTNIVTCICIGTHGEDISSGSCSVYKDPYNNAKYYKNNRCDRDSCQSIMSDCCKCRCPV